ncbi:expressed unknown protein [Seminavis robusta]|uniref:Uncharacterized protein n=1 Tax=Seminavis robusta TaxID=568900 RepID=A0A9N8DCY4_9STRA|nr:expressed unknown protein [Seminavis robusta]|eukprot:Sro96_g049660.1 n/a (564) ;mRNA; r:91133-92853
MKQQEQQQSAATNDAADDKTTEEERAGCNANTEFEDRGPAVLYGSIAPLPSVDELQRCHTSTGTPGSFAVAPIPFAINDPPVSMEPPMTGNLHGSIAPLPSVNELGRGHTRASTSTITSTPGAFAVAPTPFVINDPPPPSMEPMASTADDSRLVEAELVTPPVEAIQVLSSDDLESQRKKDIPEPTMATTSVGCLFRCFFVPWWLLWLLHFFMAISMNDAGAANLSLPEIITPAPTYDYPCFSESLELNFALVENPQQDLFVMCPNSHIQIGIMRIPNVNNTYRNGQEPLYIVRSNVEVRCGLDGSSSNNCTLDGGTSQLVIMYYGENQYGITQQDVQNVTVRGITFTGTLDQHFQFGSASVLVANQQAKDIQLIDCRWQHISVQFFLVYVGINPYLWSQGTMSLPTQGNQVSIANSTFTNITYGSALFVAMDQVISIERSHFSGLKVVEDTRYCDLQGPVFCTNVMYCALESQCSMHATCLEDVEYFADAGLLIGSPQAEWDISSIHLANNGDLVLADRQLDANLFENCDSGVGQYNDDMFRTMECFDPAPLYDTSPVCPLL